MRNLREKMQVCCLQNVKFDIKQRLWELPVVGAMCVSIVNSDMPSSIPNHKKKVTCEHDIDVKY